MNLIIYALAVWRLSRLLVKEDGPYEIFRRLRIRSGIEYAQFDRDAIASWPDWNPLTCMCCTSVYTAAMLYKMPQSLLNILAASSVAVLLDKIDKDD